MGTAQQAHGSSAPERRAIGAETEWGRQITEPQNIEPELKSKIDQIVGRSIYSCATRTGVIAIHDGILYRTGAIVRLPALKPIRIEGIYFARRSFKTTFGAQQRSDLGLYILLHLDSDQYAIIPAAAADARFRESDDPLNLLLGGGRDVYLDPVNLPFSAAETEAIQTHRFQSGDLESTVECSLGQPERRENDIQHRQVLVYPDYARITMEEGRVFAVQYLGAPKSQQSAPKL